VVWLPPFLDAAPFVAARRERGAHRARLASAHGIDPAVPWISIAAMTRPGDKLASFRALAAMLSRVADLPWRLLVAGDGAARVDAEAAFAAQAPGRAHFLGTLRLEDVAALAAASELCAWPAVNEAYGMALLEAAAAGIPTVACAVRGVPDVVLDGKTGLLAAPGDEAGLAAHVRRLLLDQPLRESMGRAASAFAAGERSVEAAARRLNELLPKAA
jgi:glycosyltransferase involved in cell wall biosynthesis